MCEYKVFSLRNNKLQPFDMLLYFKFLKVSAGYELYDFSPQREHCKILDNSVWVQVPLGTEIYNQKNSPQYDWSSKMQMSLAFINTGRTIPIPRQITEMEEGLTVEMWFYLASAATDSTWNLEFYQYTFPVTLRLFINGVDLQSFTSVIASSAQTCSLSITVPVGQWVFFSSTYHPPSATQSNYFYFGGPSWNSCSFTYSTFIPQYSPSNPTFSFLNPKQCSSSCSGFKVYGKELKIWDTWRSVESIKKYAQTNFTDKVFPSVIAYWRFNYEIENYGWQVLDYSKNGNTPINIVPTLFQNWNAIPPALTLCLSNQVLSSSWTCVTDQTSEWSQKQLLKNNYANNSLLLADNSSIPGWQWLAEFWMIKQVNTDPSILFYNPPIEYVDYIDQLTGGYTSMGWVGTVVQHKFYIGLHQYCYMKNINNCRGSVNCNPNNVCSPLTNATSFCRNLCEDSTGCTNYCTGVPDCITLCDNATSCTANYKNSLRPQFSCTSAVSCTINIWTSNHYFVDCQSVSVSCSVIISQNFNTISSIPSDLVYNAKYFMDCQGGALCSLNTQDSSNQIIDCSSSSNCQVQMTNIVSSKLGSFYAYSTVFAFFTSAGAYSFTNCDFVMVDLRNATLASYVRIVTSNEGGLTGCSKLVMNKVNAESAIVNEISFDNSGGSSFCVGIYINCKYGKCSNNVITKAPYCPGYSYMSVIDCQFASQCINACSATHQCVINCDSSSSCVSTVDMTGVPLNVLSGNLGLRVFPWVSCVSGTCTQTFKNQWIFYMDCTQATYCYTLTSYSATQEVGYASAGYATYSMVKCTSLLISKCHVSLTASPLVFVDLSNSVRASVNSISLASINKVFISGMPYYPVIYAQYSSLNTFSISSTQFFFLDCFQSTSCQIYLSSVGLTSPTNLLTLNCTNSISCSVTAANTQALNVKCSTSTSCSSSLTTSWTSYASACSIVYPFTIFNFIDCSNSLSSCSLYCNNAKFCFMNCQGGQNCQSTLVNMNMPSTPYLCGTDTVYSYIDCLNAVCTNSVGNTVQQVTLVYYNCPKSCTNSLTKVNGLGIGVGSLYPYVNCQGATSCSNDLSDVQEYYINCRNTVLCANTQSGTSNSFGLNIYGSYNSFSVIDCSNSQNCQNTISRGDLTQVICAGATICLNTFKNIVVQVNTVYRGYPQVDCRLQIGLCKVIVQNFAVDGGMYVLCPTSGLYQCQTNYIYLQEFSITCGGSTALSWNCWNTIQNSATSDFSYQSALETIYSLILCTTPGVICVNSITSSSMVYISCPHLTKCTNTFTSSTVTLDSTLNQNMYPYVNCYGQQSGICSNTFNTYETVLINCENSRNCQNSLSGGDSTDHDETYINCRGANNCQTTCTSTEFCLVDCSKSDLTLSNTVTCKATFMNSIKSSYFTDKVPSLYCLNQNGCVGKCQGSTECLLYGVGSTSGNFLIQLGPSGAQLAEAYSVIYSINSTNTVNKCDQVQNCYIFCGQNSVSCTNTLSSILPSTPESYSIIDCTSATSCTNSALLTLYSFIICRSASSCVNTITTSSASGTLYPVIDATYCANCATTCNLADGCFIDCSYSTTQCKATIKNSPLSTVDTTISSLYSYIRCNYGQNCIISISNSSLVVIDCQNAISCQITVDMSSYIYISCQGAGVCSVSVGSSGGTQMTNVNVDCSGILGSCIVDIAKVDNVQFSCDGVIGVQCTLTTENVKTASLDFIGTDTSSYSCTNSDSVTLFMSGTSWTQTNSGCTNVVLDSITSVPSTAQICVDITSCAQVISRSISSSHSNKYTSFVEANLLNGLPPSIGSLLTRLNLARTQLTDKQALVMSKVILTPKKYPLPSLFKYQPNEINQKQPAFQTFAPVTIKTIPTTEVMIPTLNKMGSINYTVPQMCQNYTFYPEVSARYDYLQNQWNHIVLGCDQQKLTTCINNYCYPQVNTLASNMYSYNATNGSYGIMNNVMHFLYDLEGRATEFKLWKWDSSSKIVLDLVRQFYMRRGPFGSTPASYLMSYYKFEVSSTLDMFLYDYQLMERYSSQTQYITTVISDTFVAAATFDASYTSIKFCQDGLQFDGFSCSGNFIFSSNQGGMQRQKLQLVRAISCSTL